MSDETPTWLQRHMKVFSQLMNKASELKAKMKPPITKHVLEPYSALLWVLMILWAEVLCLILFVFLFFKCGILGKLFCIWYLTHMYNDRKSSENGQRGQGNEYIRNLSLYKHFSNHFPVKVVKTVDLPATQNYLFAVFPHGVISMGVFCNFGTSTTNFRELFPGIRSKVCTLNFHFFIPFYREMVLAWGMLSAKPESLRNVLTQSNNKLAVCNYDGYTSNAAVLVVGGAQEAIFARPGCYRLTLNKRKGFVKMAIQTGAALVPVFSFGEVDILDQPSNEPGSLIRNYQETVKKFTGITPAFAYGRGFTENTIGMIPYRHPINTVIGAPIEVKQNPNPTADEINELHSKYAEELGKLFETHKAKYVKNHETAKLVFE